MTLSESVPRLLGTGVTFISSCPLAGGRECSREGNSVLSGRNLSDVQEMVTLLGSKRESLMLHSWKESYQTGLSDTAVRG